MKYLDRFINYIFSLFILILSAVIAFIAAGLIEYRYVSDSISDVLFNNENRTTTCIVAIVVFFAALKTTIFLSRWNKKKKAVVMVDTNHGKIQIAQETIENTAKGVTRQYDEVKDTMVRMTKEKKGINLYMALLVEPNTNIMELTSKIQDQVKEAVEGTTGVKVNNVDIKIKNIAEGKAKEKNSASRAIEKAVVNEEPMDEISSTPVLEEEPSMNAVEEQVETESEGEQHE